MSERSTSAANWAEEQQHQLTFGRGSLFRDIFVREDQFLGASDRGCPQHVIVDMPGIHSIDPLGILEDAIGPKQRERSDLPVLLFLVELVHREQLPSPWVATVDTYII